MKFSQVIFILIYLYQYNPVIQQGFGMILGPLTGSLLFKLGGYSLPFYVMAGLLFLAALAAFFALEQDDEIVRSGYSNIDGEEITEEFEEEFPLRKVVKAWVLLSDRYFLIFGDGI